MRNMSKSFNKQAIFTQSILKAITEYADEGNTLENIQDYVLNSDPWTWIIGRYIGRHKAVEALKSFNEQDQLYEKTELNGVSGAIQYVQDYENAEFGGANIHITNLSNPESVATMVSYINGKQIINKLADKLNLELNDNLTKQQAAILSNVEIMQKLLK